MTHDILSMPPAMPEPWHGIVTQAPEMRALFPRLERAARSDASVLIRGDTGTGKELVARALHRCSARSAKAFRAVNCAGFAGDLLASELFGHERGAFTGAIKDKPGLFSLADGGTIFLDEVAETSLEVQARLLRVLQERTFIPVGGTNPVEVDVRIVSATHEPLRRLVEQHRFRADLMYRIRVVLIYLPRLAERTGDVEVLFWHFVRTFNARGGRKVTGIARDAMEALMAYPWPGNVRELRNNVEQAFVLGTGETIRLDEFTPEVQEGLPSTLFPGDHPELSEATTDPSAGSAPETTADPASPSSPPAGVSTHPPPRPPAAPPIHERGVTLEDLERNRIIRAMEQAGGRKGEAAEILGISRSTLWRKLKKHGLQ